MQRLVGCGMLLRPRREDGAIAVVVGEFSRRVLPILYPLGTGARGCDDRLRSPGTRPDDGPRFFDQAVAPGASLTPAQRTYGLGCASLHSAKYSRAKQERFARRPSPPRSTRQARCQNPQQLAVVAYSVR